MRRTSGRALRQRGLRFSQLEARLAHRGGPAERRQGAGWLADRPPIRARAPCSPGERNPAPCLRSAGPEPL